MPKAENDAPVSEGELRAFIMDAVRQNRSLPAALLAEYRITRPIPPGEKVIIHFSQGDLDAAYNGDIGAAADTVMEAIDNAGVLYRDISEEA